MLCVYGAHRSLESGLALPQYLKLVESARAEPSQVPSLKAKVWSEARSSYSAFSRALLATIS